MNLPEEYTRMSDAETTNRIRHAKQTLGTSVTILAHYYQRDEIVQFADFCGDSLELSRRAAQTDQAKYIVFCGVHFMAETAATLCQPNQAVIQPVPEATCPMALMATATDAEKAWIKLASTWPEDLIPIVYQNSTLALKAFAGRHGGFICTSANASKAFAWALKCGRRILFMPDEHLGRNTALSSGVPPKEIISWNPLDPPDTDFLARCRIAVWNGFCHVHTAFSRQDVEGVRARHPDSIVIVHPECPNEIVSKADSVGSTTGIIRAVKKTPQGKTIAIGTEWHLVNRLSQEFPEKTIFPLRQSVCHDMAVTHIRHLLYALECILKDDPRNIIQVDPDESSWARLALEKMFKLA